MSHSRAVVSASFAAALFLGAGLGETTLAATTIGAGDASVAEGNSGSQTLAVPVTRTGSASGAIAIQYQTDVHPVNPATPDTDYVSISAGVALVPAGAVTGSLPVSVAGDSTVEPDENFYVHILSALNVGAIPDYAAAVSFSAGATPHAVVMADFNIDGHPDLAVANGNDVSVLASATAAGATTPSFGAAQALPAGSNPSGVASADFNGDGKPDLAVANIGGANVSVLLNTTVQGDATPAFAAATPFATGSYPIVVTTGDINGDGKPDLAVANLGSGDASILLNTTATGAATASFAAAVNVGGSGGVAGVALGDVNGDGRPDLAVASFNAFVVVRLNLTSPGATTPGFSAANFFSAGYSIRSVAFGDVNGDGKLDLAAADQTTGNAYVLLNTTTPGAGSVSLSTAQAFAVGGGSYTVAVGDLNGDGKPDLAVANIGANTTSVLLNVTPPGSSTAAFATRQDLAGAGAQGVAIGDLNGDGRRDLAVANSNGGTVSVFLGVLAQTAGVQTFAVGAAPGSVATGDLNGDGKLDLAAANINDNSVSVLLNTSAGSIAYAAKQDFAVGAQPVSVAMGDVNGDGKPDLAVADFGSDTSVSVLMNTTATGSGTASFASAVDFTTGKQPRGVCFGDFNGDGKPDLAVIDFFDSTISVLLNTTAPGAATPTFAARQAFSTLFGLSVASGDINGDGRPDLVVAGVDANGNGAAVLLNTTANGAAVPSFSGSAYFVAGNTSYGVAVSDLNADGKPDLAVANANSDNVSVLLNTTPANAGTPVFSAKQDFAAGASPIKVAATDLDADGKPDLVVANANANSVSVLRNITAANASTASFAARADTNVGSAPAAVAAGDLDGDGSIDVAVANQSSNDVSAIPNSLLAGAPPPSLAAASASATGAGPVSVAVGDLNGDGVSDLAVANVSGNDVSVLLNTTAAGAAAPTFSAAIAVATGTNPRQVVRGDINNDGLPDLTVVNQTGNNAQVFLNTTPPGSATPSFGAGTSIGIGSAPRGLALGDLNGDGNLDLVATRSTASFGSTVVALVNATTPGGTPSFNAGVAFGFGDLPLGVALGDINRDGRLDIVVAYYNNNYVEVFLNTTTPGATSATFAAQSTLAVGSGPFAVALADIDGDGLLDIVSANANSNDLSILMNATPLGAGTQSFAAQRTVTAGTSPVSVGFGDFNGDGRTDLEVGNSSGANASILLNTTPAGAAAPSFTASTDFSGGSGAGSVASGDFNGDGMTDVAVANNSGNTVSVLLNNLRAVAVADAEGTGTILNDDVPDTTPDAFAFSDQSGVPVGSVRESDVLTATGFDTVTAISVTGGEYRVNGGTYVSTGGTIDPGSTFQVRHTASASFNTAADTVLTIGGVSDTFTSTTESADTTPFVFAFTDVTDVAVGSAQESDIVTITGINTASAVSVSGGEYRKNGGGYTAAAGSVVNGDTVQVRHTASLMYSTATDTTLTVGGVSDTFTSTTAAQDTTPGVFTFVDQTNVALGSVAESNIVTIAGINAPAGLSVSGGEYRKNGGSYTTAAGTIENGDTVQVRHTASSTPATTVDTTLTVGGVSDTFSSTTVPADTTPAAFSFTDQGDVTPGSTVTSDTITVSGINTGAAISVTGGSYRIDGGAFTSAAGTVQNGQTVQLQHTAASSFAAATDTTLTIGGVSDIFTSTTAAQDTTPNAFTFTDVTGIAPGSVQESNVVTIAAITGAVAVSVTGGEYRKNGGAYTSAAGTVANGDTLQLRQAASSAAATTTTAVLTVGTMSDNWSVTTASAPAGGGGGGGGPLSPATLLLLGLAQLARAASSGRRWVRGPS